MFPTNEEVLEFYKDEYIKRHGNMKFEEEILRFYAYRPASMFFWLLEDYIYYKKFD